MATPTSPTVRDLVAGLEVAYRGAADPGRAAAMRVYMRDQFAFLGLGAPVRRALDRQVLTGRRLEPADALAVAEWCWTRDEREFQYAGLDVLQKAARRLPADALGRIRCLIEIRSWWDTVDALAALVVGPMVLAHPDLVVDVDRWIDDRDLWVVRSALLHQLTYRDHTDAERLFAYCRRRADHRDVFVRKAIGWALRQYARTEPEAVRRFLADHGDELSALSVREAAKHLG